MATASCANGEDASQEQSWRLSVMTLPIRARTAPIAEASVLGNDPEAICVVGVFVRDGMVLLVHRAPRLRVLPNDWGLFGGHLQRGESLRGGPAARGTRRDRDCGARAQPPRPDHNPAETGGNHNGNFRYSWAVGLAL